MNTNVFDDTIMVKGGDNDMDDYCKGGGEGAGDKGEWGRMISTTAVGDSMRVIPVSDNCSTQPQPKSVVLKSYILALCMSIIMHVLRDNCDLAKHMLKHRA